MLANARGGNTCCIVPALHRNSAPQAQSCRDLIGMQDYGYIAETMYLLIYNKNVLTDSA